MDLLRGSHTFDNHGHADLGLLHGGKQEEDTGVGGDMEGEGEGEGEGATSDIREEGQEKLRAARTRGQWFE